MLRCALILLTMAMVIGLFSLGGLATGALGLMHLLAMAFITLAVLGLIGGMLSGR